MTRLTNSTVNIFLDAIQDGKEQQVRTLLRQYPDLARRNFGKLDVNRMHVAASHNRTSIIKLLIEHGSTTEVRSAKGYMPLHAAIESRHKDVVIALLEARANPNARVKDLGGEGMYALHMAALYKEGHAIIRLLLAHGAHVDAAFGPTQVTPLYTAAKQGNTENVRLLLNAGADPTRLVGEHTALSIAEDNKALETAELIRSWIDADKAKRAVDAVRSGFHFDDIKPLGFALA